MGGTIVPTRYFARRDYDEDLLRRAKISRDLLARAPDDSDSPYPEEGEVRMDKDECFDYIRRACVALDFFEPHFKIYDEIMARAREDFAWRAKEFFYRLFRWKWTEERGDDRYVKTRRGLESILDEIALKPGPDVIIENRILRAASNWIDWHAQEAPNLSQGVYR